MTTPEQQLHTVGYLYMKLMAQLCAQSLLSCGDDVHQPHTASSRPWSGKKLLVRTVSQRLVYVNLLPIGCISSSIENELGGNYDTCSMGGHVRQ